MKIDVILGKAVTAALPRDTLERCRTERSREQRLLWLWLFKGTEGIEVLKGLGRTLLASSNGPLPTLPLPQEGRGCSKHLEQS